MSEHGKDQAAPTLLQYFGYQHLPAREQRVSKPFHDLALDIAVHLPNCEERHFALRKLLEAKDCAVRAALMEEKKDG